MPRVRTWTTKVSPAIQVVLGAAVGLSVALAGLTGSVNPFVHTICKNAGPISSDVPTWIPEMMVNSPYGGMAGGNATGGPGGGLGNWGIDNGSATWSGYKTLVTIDALQNQTVFGLGRNSRCSSGFLVTMSTAGPRATGVLLMGPGNQSDRAEPHSLILGEPNNITINNSFTQANSEVITTCSGSPVHKTVVATNLTVWYSYRSGSQNRTVEVHVPLPEVVFTYTFDAGFGTWAVDNLSAPGGPGGGWAFDYLGPCG